MPAPIHISAKTKVLAMSKDNAPAVRVPQNTPVSFETMDCFSNSLRSEADLFSSVGWECINPATGPVFIEGAEPGDMLRVDILDIQVADQGVVAAAPGFGEMPDSVAETTCVVPVRDGKAYFSWKSASGAIHRELPINPMIGVIGVAPAGEAVPTGCPDSHGGNMDCKRIVKGARLYLPVNVPGALFAAGDLHALMADGEVVVCGVEIAGLVTVSFKVIKGKRWPLPVLVEGEVRPLREVSPLVSILERAQKATWRFGVYCRAEDRDAVAQAARRALNLKKNKLIYKYINSF